VERLTDNTLVIHQKKYIDKLMKDFKITVLPRLVSPGLYKDPLYSLMGLSLYKTRFFNILVQWVYKIKFNKSPWASKTIFTK
jgi:hypothetical protein